MKCENCGARIGTLKQWLFGETPICDDCESDGITQDLYDKLDVNIISEDSSDEEKQEIERLALEKLKEMNVPLEYLEHAEMTAINITEMGKKDPEFHDKMRLMNARDVFQKVMPGVLMILHDLKHIGVPESELKILGRKFTSFSHELVQDYLWTDGDGENGWEKKSEDEVYDLMMESILNCED